MINEFKVEGVIERIGNGRVIWLKYNRTTSFCFTASNKLGIKKYCIGDEIEVSGHIATYGPLCAIRLVATKIKKIGGQEK